jgi:DnaJ-class molecular chaperone
MKGYKRVRRPVWVLCPQCFGGGSVGKDGQRIRCNYCDGKGEIEKWVNEVKHDETLDKH